MKTKLFTFFLTLAISAGTMFAQSGTCGDNLTWDLTDGVLTISGTGDMTNYTYNGSPWYSYCLSITKVVIGNSVTKIGSYAFFMCDGLTSVTIPNSVTSIGKYAFRSCTKLTSIEIPNSVTSIGDWAFSNCTGLTSVTIPNSVTSIAEGAFYGCTGLTSVTIPNSVTSIGQTAFSGCISLISVIVDSENPNYDSRDNCNAIIETSSNTLIEGCRNTIIPNSITSIGKYAFSGCTGLTSIEIPNSVKSIGSYAFEGCYKLTSVTIPNSVTSIGNSAFSKVPNIVYNGTATGSPWGARSVNGYVDGWLIYSDASKTSLLACYAAATGEIVIPNSVTSIGSYAFYDCTALASIEIPNSVTSIGFGAFLDCTGLTSIEIPNSVKSIGEYAFVGCSGLTSITCEATTPPSCMGNSFGGVDKSIPLYVLAESVDLYKAAEGWKDFENILPISAEETETTEVQTTTTENSVEVTWPAVDGAYTYELVIKDKKGNTICTLIFDAEGRLKSIAFSAPAHGDAPQKAQTAGFSFTVTGLDAGKEYNLTITAKDNNGATLDEKSMVFHTDWPTAIDEVQSDKVQSTKIFHGGKVFIRRGEKVYTLQGQEVR